MLSLIQLQSSEMPTFDVAKAPAMPMSGGGAVFEGTFSDMLQVRVAAGTPSQPDPGEALPPTGHELPLLPSSQDLLLQNELPMAREASAWSIESSADANAMALPELALTDWPAFTNLSGLSTAGSVTDLAMPSAPAGPGTQPVPELESGLSRTTLQAETTLAVRLNVLNSGQIGLDGALPGALVGASGNIDRPVADALTADALRPAPMPTISIAERDRTTPPRNAAFASIDSVSTLMKTPDAVAETLEPGLLMRQGGLTEERMALIRDGAQAVSRLQLSQSIATDSLELDPASLSAMSSRTLSDAAPVAPRLAVAQALDLHVQHPGWDKTLSERVLLMANGKMQNVEIRLTPAELGPLRVQLSIDDTTARVSFQVQHAVTREAIEQALPRLRDMLAENGLSLGQADVSDAGVQRETQDGMTRSPSEGLTGGDEAGGEEPTRPVAASIDALVDTFV